ncbi:MAG: HAMP domain-containing sensor histidine kinase [Candidatus Izemoplasma sp.]
MRFPKKINNSFIKKIFFSLSLLFLIVFIIIFFLQSIIFKEFYTQRTIDTNITLIDEFFDDITISTINDKTISFMQDTNTTTLFAPYEDFESGFNSLNLIKITVTQGIEDYIIYVPYVDDLTYEENQQISATIVEVSATNEYIPIHLIIDGEMIVKASKGSIDNVYTDFIPNINRTLKIDIIGTITNIELSEVDNTQLHPIISNEILNIATENYTEITEFGDNGIYYFTNDSTNENLVFLATTTIDGEDYILVSVYSMSHIDDVVTAVRLVNIYLFGLIFIILIFTSFIYSKQFAKPLVSINNSTKELSKLNFDTQLIEITGEDEFAELAKNINTLSINLKNTLAELEEKNKQLSISFARENQNELMRKDFVSGMSHELKTPLAIIQASAESLEKNIFVEEDERNEQLILIQKEIKRTNKMIHDMLNVYNLDVSSFSNTFVEFSFKKLILQSIQNILPLVKNKSLNLESDIADLYFTGDAEKIELVVNNLVTNAIKYTPDNESIIITLIESNNVIQFSITNTGSCIQENDMTKLFEPFYRVDKARTRADGSSGLGLYIVNQILSQYGSYCEVQSKNNSVTFSFKLKSN